MRLGIIYDLKMFNEEKHSQASVFNHIYNYLNMSIGWQQTLDNVTTGDAAKTMSNAALTTLLDLKGMLWWIEHVHKKGASDMTVHPLEFNAKSPTELETFKALAAEGLTVLRKIPVMQRGRGQRREAKSFIKSLQQYLAPPSSDATDSGEVAASNSGSQSTNSGSQSTNSDSGRTCDISIIARTLSCLWCGSSLSWDTS
jgi:hypothetical protein